MFKGISNWYKNRVRMQLEQLVVQYFQAHPEVRLVVVAGSVGKTSTKAAIGTVLRQKYRVRVHEGNHNTPMSVPLAILGVKYPDNVHSIFAWQDALKAARNRVLMPTDVDVIVQELGADRVGDIAAFSRYLHPHMSLVTAVTPEHMEYFQTIENVAREELTAANFSQVAFINRDDIDGRFAEFITNPNIHTYGTTSSAEYRFEEQGFDLESGRSGVFISPEMPDGVEVSVKLLGTHNLRPAVAAATIGVKFGLSREQIKMGLEKLEPVSGRMNLLKGLNTTTIIDDTYNSSPAAASSAVTTLLEIEAPQRIAIMGDMNELGGTSPDEHKKIGQMFHPDQVDWVITIGPESEKYLAPAAQANGCQTKSFQNAVQAGAFARSVSKPGALILIKGSQGDVYAEEAVKIMLVNQNDISRLVRQSPMWMAVKERFFQEHLV